MVSGGTEHLIETFIQTSRLLKERLFGSHRDGRISMPQMGALMYIAEQGTPTMRQLATHMGIRPASATSLTHGLVRAKLLVRRVDRKDRRVVRLAVTAVGRTLLRTLMGQARQRLGQVLGALNVDDREHLGHILEQLRGVMTASGAVQ